MKIVTLSGSLRAASSNGALLRAVGAVAPDGVEVLHYTGLGGLPHFNPDLDAPELAPPPAVAEFRALLASADGFVVSTPEYVHGLPGAFKNALDWIVSSGEFSKKPVLIINASSSGGQFAQAALVEILSTMEARVLADATVVAPRARREMTKSGEIADAAVLNAIKIGVQALISALSAQ